MDAKQDNSRMSNVDSLNPTVIKGDEIDLIVLIKTIWINRKKVLMIISFFVLIGLFYAIVKPVKYSSHAVLLPSVAAGNGQLGSIGALAGLAGINIGALGSGTNNIPSELYPQIVESYPFQNELVHEEYLFESYSHPISYYDFYMADTIKSFSDYLVDYTILLPWTIKEMLEKNSGNSENGFNLDHIVRINKEEESMFLQFKEHISINVNNITGLITIHSNFNEPIVVAQMVNKTIEKLQLYAIDYRTKQVRQNLNFIQERFEEKKLEYENLQRRLYDYRDKHRNVVSERVEFEYQILNDEYNVVSSVYNGLSQQLEQARIALSENTPVFSVIEPPQVPIEKSGPRKIIVLIVSGFLGLIFGVAFIFIQNYYYTGKERWSKLNI